MTLLPRTKGFLATLSALSQSPVSGSKTSEQERSDVRLVDVTIAVYDTLEKAFNQPPTIWQYLRQDGLQGRWKVIVVWQSFSFLQDILDVDLNACKPIPPSSPLFPSPNSINSPKDDMPGEQNSLLGEETEAKAAQWLRQRFYAKDALLQFIKEECLARKLWDQEAISEAIMRYLNQKL